MKFMKNFYCENQNNFTFSQDTKINQDLEIPWTEM